MKKAFKTSVAALMILTAIFAACSLAGCEKNDDLFGKNDTMTLVIGTDEPEEYTVNLEGLSRECNLLDVLNAAKEQFEVEYVEKDGMLFEVGALKPDSGKGEYIYLFTTVKSDFDVSEYVKTMTYKETSLTSSGVGASKMTIFADCTVYIGTIIYG